MKSLIGILAVLAMLYGEAFACKGMAGQRNPAPEARQTTASAEAAPLFEKAAALEREGNGRDAVKAYVRAARAGSGAAALRLGQIYEKGIKGVEPNHPESLKWKHAALAMGEDVALAKCR